MAEEQAGARVAYDTDGDAWDEIIADNGEPTAMFKFRSEDGDGDELTLGQLDELYGLEALDSGERARERSSRQAWAEEAPVKVLTDTIAELYGEIHEFAEENRRLRREVEFEALGGVGLIGLADVAGLRDNLRYPLCACVTDEQAAALVEAGFTRPQCTVHPQGGQA